MNTYLKAKVTCRISSCQKDYEGSLTLDSYLMNVLGVRPYEQVWINSKDKPVRIMTYIIPGAKGQCEANGGAAQYFEVGDIVHLLFFTTVAKPKQPKVINLVI